MEIVTTSRINQCFKILFFTLKLINLQRYIVFKILLLGTPYCQLQFHISYTIYIYIELLIIFPSDHDFQNSKIYNFKNQEVTSPTNTHTLYPMAQPSLRIQETFTDSFGPASYTITINANDDNLLLTIQDPRTSEKWTNTFSHKYVSEITEKAGHKIPYRLFVTSLHTAMVKKTDSLFINIMSSFQLENIKAKRGGQPSTTSSKSNKRYVILSYSHMEQRSHYPLPLNFVQADSPQALTAMIDAVREELEQLRAKHYNHADKSSSIMSEMNTNEAEVIKQENQQLKQLIKEAEQKLTQKKGAVEMDQIIRQKYELEMRVDAVRREQAKEIAKLKTVYALKQREIDAMRNEINIIKRQLQSGEQTANPKLKNHILRVTKANETELNNSKKLVTKQMKEIENINRNLQNAKNAEKKILMKIKQLQTEIEQAKKKANLKEISNRLHSPASSKKSNLSAPNNNARVVGNIANRGLLHRNSATKTDDNSSVGSGFSKPRSYSGSAGKNITKPIVPGPPKPQVHYRGPQTNPLLRTTPALKSNSRDKNSTLNVTVPTATVQRPYTRNQPPSTTPTLPKDRTPSAQRNKRSVPPPSSSLERKFNNFLKPKVPTGPVTAKSTNTVNRSANLMKPNISTSGNMQNGFSKDKTRVIGGTTEQGKIKAAGDIMNRIEEMKNRFGVSSRNPTINSTNNKPSTLGRR